MKNKDISRDRIKNPDFVMSTFSEIKEKIIEARVFKCNFELLYKDISYDAIIKKVDDYHIFLQTERVFQMDQNITDIEVFFNLKEYRYSFNTTLISADAKQERLSVPHEIFVYKMRSADRINVKNKIFLKFSIISSGVHVAKKYDVTKKSGIIRSVYSELNKDESSLDDIFKLIRSELLKHAFRVNIKLKKKGEPQELSSMIISEYKKPLYIDNTRDLKSYLKKYTDTSVISYLPYFQKIKDLGWDLEQVKQSILTIREKEMSRGVISYIIFPILIFNSVVGFVRIMSREGSIHSSGRSTVFKECVSLATEAVMKNYLFNIDSNQDYTMHAVDISPKGLLFLARDPNLIKYLKKGVKLKITMKLENNQIETVTGVIRRLEDSAEGKMAGIEFNDIRITTKNKIATYLSTITDLKNIDDILDKL
ncbi:PilZ domain-containing protein [Spirochaetota bacterium]